MFSANVTAKPGYYTISGVLKSVTDNGDGTATISLDTDEDGDADFTRTLEVTSQQLIDLRTNIESECTISYHTKLVNGQVVLVLDSVSFALSIGSNYNIKGKNINQISVNKIKWASIDDEIKNK